MATGNSDKPSSSRRDFLATMTAGAGSALLSMVANAKTPEQPAASRPRKRSAEDKLNIVFVFTDQERYFPHLPSGYSLPGHERLARKGVTFQNHYCPAVMCTSSRAVLLTGLQTADNRMFENADTPWVKALSTEVPTVGHMLRKAGYYTAYKGKWHLNHEFDNPNADKLFTSEMEEYGFSDFVWPGDVLAHALGGYRFDNLIAGTAVSWLRNKGRPLADDGKPWALFVSLVNPHDIMYFNTDLPGQKVQDTGRLMMKPTFTPPHPDYKARWNAPLPASLNQPFDEPGRPRAHGEFDRAWGYTLGHIPLEAARWHRFTDYYLNCIRAVDAHLLAIQKELEALGLADRTVFVFTSDHGEMGGAHGLRGKGAFSYEEITHLPMYVTHPDVRGGQTCRALTSHIDFAPTLLTLAGMDRARIGEAAGRDLPGKDFGPALGAPASAGVNSVRDAVLFTFSGLAQTDSNLMRVIAEGTNAGKDIKTSIKESGFKPDLKKRGSLRMAFDGRHKYTRYFSPLERNRPTTLEDIYRLNEPELFDLKSDPREMKNLAATKGANEALVLAMNDKLNAVIASEIGKDDGREMPQVEGISWGAERLEL